MATEWKQILALETEVPVRQSVDPAGAPSRRPQIEQLADERLGNRAARIETGVQEAERQAGLGGCAEDRADPDRVLVHGSGDVLGRKHVAALLDRDVPRLDVEVAREFLPDDLDALLARLRR